MRTRPYKLNPGRPTHSPTPAFRRTVVALSTQGYSQDRIADVLGIAPKTLRLHYRREIEVGKGMVDADMVNSLIMQGVGGPKKDWSKAVTAATIFYLKTQCGWTDKQQVEHSGAVGSYDLTQLAGSELDNLIATLERIEVTPNRGGARREDTPAT